MKLYDKNTLKNIGVFTLIGILLIPAVVWAIDTVATGFRATATEKKIDIVAASEAWHTANDCYYVRSKTASDYFVPSKTSAEWSAYKSNHSTAEMEKWVCWVPENNCRISYDWLIDWDDAPIKYTPYTNNTSTYQIWPYSLDERNDDEHCNGWCGLRAWVQCTNNDYAIRVWYQFDMKNSISPIVYSSWSDVSTALWAWAQRSTNGEYECSQWCWVRMFIETRWDDALVNCSIGYRHRIDNTESAWGYDGAWATFTNSSGDWEDCENWNCWLQVRLYCDWPGGANSSSSSSSSSWWWPQCPVCWQWSAGSGCTEPDSIQCASGETCTPWTASPSFQQWYCSAWG